MPAGNSTYKEWTSALLQSDTDFEVYSVEKILFYNKCIRDEQYFTAYFYRIYNHKVWKLSVQGTGSNQEYVQTYKHGFSQKI
jgi:hypothetical protein